MFLILFAGCIQAASAIQGCVNATVCTDLLGYNVSVGVVSSVLVLGYLILFTFASLPEQSMMILSIFLFIWWMAAVAVLTFYFTVGVGAAYFAIWMCFLLSGFIMHSEVSQFRTAVDRVNSLESGGKYTFYLLLASLVELIAAGVVCGAGCGGYQIYAVIVGAISFLFCLILLLASTSYSVQRVSSIFLCLWWAVGTGVLTILSPFLVVGNGFFACWFAFFVSFLMAQDHFFPAA